MKLIVGLGNPGKKYEKTRHNLGYRVVDSLADSLGFSIDKVAFNGLYTKETIFGEPVILFKPTTYMNLSGTAVQEIKAYFNIATDDMLIIYDDMALEPGRIRLRPSGSSGGHNGIQNIMEVLKTEDIKRLRVGIGEPEYDGMDYVLGKPTKEQAKLIDIAVGESTEALKVYLRNGFTSAMAKYN
ncbi:MAG: aminoacyl-tRNA hydrolase [Bacilli bacterium]|jgi:PTH1 family peptidyl-tRNA hydrolase